MTHYKDQILACDFFTIETLFLKMIYVLFFIEVGSRRVHFAGCTTNPDSAWMSQQARQLVWSLDDRYGRTATMVVTQIPVSDWHDRIPDPTLADAILDRLIHNAHRLELKGESMRKRQSPLGADPNP